MLLAVLALLLGAGLFLSRPPRQRTGGTGSPDHAVALTARFLELEREAMRHDETTWAAEMEALRAGQPIAQLWDQLRGSTNAWQLLGAFPFGELSLPELGQGVEMDNGIVERTFVRSELPVTLEQWRQRLSKFEAEGNVLDQSEWRQARYVPAGSDPARSYFDVELHVRHAASGTRHQAAFQLEIIWGNQPEMRPVSVRVISGKVLSRTGTPEFEPWFAMELGLVPGLETLDPFLAVYDLNGDLRPEIMVAVQNTALRPKGGRYAPEALCAQPVEKVHAALFGDFDGEGTVDYLCANLDGLHLFRGTEHGTFPDAATPAWKARETLFNPFVLTSGDVDGDGDLDIFLAQYKLPYLTGQMPTPFYDANDGFASFLLLNDGKGTFADATDAAGLQAKRHRRTYSASFADLDGDSDLDLIVVSDFRGIDLYLNDGRGKFSDRTAGLIEEPHAFGMAHAIADFNLDGALDILMIGMNSDAAARLDAFGSERAGFPRHAEMRRRMSHGNRLYLREAEVYRERSAEMNLAKSGWSWGVAAFDYDGDLDEDVYLVNGHNSRASAMDYESHFWRHDVYTGNSIADPSAALFFQSFASRLYGAGWSYGGFHKNKFFINQRGTNFLEAGYLLGVALEEDCRNLARADLDGDGDLDLVLTTFQQWPAMRQTLRAFRNTRPPGAWTAVELPAKDAPGAVVRRAGGVTQVFVTGDSYRSQNPAIIWIPALTNSAIAEVHWPNLTAPRLFELKTNAIVRLAP